MFNQLTRKIKAHLLKQPEQALQSPQIYLHVDLDTNLKLLDDIFTSSDFIIREVYLDEDRLIRAAICFLNGLVDEQLIGSLVLRPLLAQREARNIIDWSMQELSDLVISSAQVDSSQTLAQVTKSLTKGLVVLLLDGQNEVLSIDLRAAQSRGVEQSESERVVRGSREGFTEILKTNVSQIRRRIHNPNLKVEITSLGSISNTEIAVIYLSGIARPELVNEVKKRLSKINTDAILESSYIEEFIEDGPLSLFTTIGNSEKPDVVAAKILEGRVAIVVDGTPFVLTAPYVFMESFQTPEDYYIRSFYASLLRLLRFVCSGISLLLPALYVAFSTFHQEMIPTRLLITMIAAREGTPFPAVIETLLFGFMFETLREGGIRLPTPVGQAISIVGALIIGDAAVSAGIVGAPMVIVVAFTAVASFVVNPQTEALTILRSLYTILAGLNLSSPSNLKDTFIRAPLWALDTRPTFLTDNTKRYKSDQGSSAKNGQK